MATRRRIGVAAIQKKQETANKFAAKGDQMAGEQLVQFSQQLDQLSAGLEMFAQKHRDEIKKNSQFRRYFQEMCSSVGVDPLASSKGFWAKALGFGDFYYELGIQIVEICLSTTHINGGIMTVEEIRNRLMRTRSRTRKDTISTDDILRAVDKLKVLGNGFELVPLGGGRFLVQSVPGELSMDHSRVLQLAEDAAYVTKELIIDKLRWDEPRATSALEHLVKEGLAWTDEQASDTTQYWFPSLFLQQYCHSSSSTSVSESLHSMSFNNYQ
ncbi:CRE-VPS-22 protein [Caenorhabditis remanei]|uniref:Vacuolar-sorting protein SNF8 n=1 Tax=Caenorhabditis remanei TaxID=31234 RepID=E3MCK8_CAERE|nr:CRE-VPS-22 protein [Caenorhabditis remanei]